MSRAMTLLHQILLAAAVGSTPLAAQGAKVSLSKIERLIGVHSPDGVVAQAIRNGGLDFSPTRATVESLRRKGAGPETLEAVQRLIWVGGHLSVEATPAGSTIDLRGPGVTHAGTVVNLPLKPGAYTVTVSKRNYKTEIRTVQMEDGSRPSLTISLAVDPEFVRSQEQSLSALLRYGRPENIVQRSRELLELDPGNLLARSAIASAYWASSSPAEYEAAARDVLGHGQSLRLNLMHEDPGTRGRRNLHNVQLTLTPTGLVYDPSPDRRGTCSLPGLTIPKSDVLEAKVVQTRMGEEWLSLQVRRPNGAGKVLELNLSVQSSRIERGGGYDNPGRLVSPPKSGLMLGAVAALLADPARAAASPAGAQEGQPASAAGAQTPRRDDAPGSKTAPRAGGALPALVVVPFGGKADYRAANDLAFSLGQAVIRAFDRTNRFERLRGARVESLSSLERRPGSGEIEDSTAALFGEQMGAQFVVTGTYTSETPYSQGAVRTSLRLNLRIVNVQTEKSEEVQVTGKGMDASGEVSRIKAEQDLNAKLEREIRNRYPALGVVTGVLDLKHARASLGPKDGLNVGDLVLVFRPGQEVKDPASGNLKRSERTLVGEAKISSFEGESAIVVPTTEISLEVGLQVESKPKSRGFRELLHDVTGGL